jgi:hypothetical protein
MNKILSPNVSIPSIVVLFIGGLSTLIAGYPVWSYILWGLAAIWLLISLIYSCTFKKESQKETDIKVVEIYEDNKGECGLIINNTGKNPLKNCHARLIDMDFEIPNSHYSLKRYPRSENLTCTKDVPEHSAGKIPLFRWGLGMSKDLEIVYESETQKIGYKIVNVPILVFLNIWANNAHAIYVICKLSDRSGWGYELSILKTATNQEQFKLANFQQPDYHKEDSQNE